MKKVEPKTYTQITKLVCDWTDEKTYSIRYRMVKFYARHRI